MSTITQRDRDCFPCRVTSGVGLVGSGAYVYIQARRFNKGALPVRIIACSLVALGFARLLELPPFNVPFRPQEDQKKS